jgi:lipopolysaccharide biosynthesis glycosyltransferase
MEPVAIGVAADSAFCKQLAVVVAGISRFTFGVPHRIFVLHDGYDRETMLRIEQSAGADVVLEWYEAASPPIDALVSDHPFLPPASLYRLRMETLLPVEVERVLFIDADIVVRGPLLELWETALGDALLGAVCDAVHPFARQSLRQTEFHVPPDRLYFNAGVMVIPLATWRARDLGAEAIALLTAHKFRYADQCALNLVVAGNWMRLAPRWNLQSAHYLGEVEQSAEPPEALAAARRDPAIIHFTLSTEQAKPWHAGPSTYRSLWLEDLDQTAWAGWRPRKAPSGTRRAWNRFKRAGRATLGRQ